MLRFVLPTIVLVLWVIAGGSLSARQDEQDIALKQIMDAWQKRRTAINTIVYKIEGTDFIAKGSRTTRDPDSHPNLHNNYPPTDVSFPKKSEWTIDFHNARLRHDQRYYILFANLGEFLPQMKVDLFDGKSAKVYTPRQENTTSAYVPSDQQPDLYLYSQTKSQPSLTYDGYPILMAHGRPILYTVDTTAQEAIQNPLDTSRFRYENSGRIRDRNCVILRTTPEVSRPGNLDEFWVDLERDGAILRWLTYVDDSPFARCDIQYGQVEGHWLPTAWRFDMFFTENGETKYSGGTFKVISVDVDPMLDSNTFTVPLKHRLVVYDSAKQASFMVGDDDQTLVRYGQSTRIIRWWAWVGFAIGIVCVFGYLCRRWFFPVRG